MAPANGAKPSNLCMFSYRLGDELLANVSHQLLCAGDEELLGGLELGLGLWLCFCVFCLVGVPLVNVGILGVEGVPLPRGEGWGTLVVCAIAAEPSATKAATA